MAGSRSGSPVKSSPKKRVKKPKTPSAHPPVAVMVTSAIKALKDRKGSSGISIKKYVIANYKVNAVAIVPHIRRFLKSGVASGKLIQSSGSGAAGRFRLGKTAAPKKKVRKAVKKTPKKKLLKSKKKKTPKKSSKKPKKMRTPKKAGASKSKSSAKSKKPKTKKSKTTKTARPKKPKTASK
jgi:histone H1/5